MLCPDCAAEGPAFLQHGSFTFVEGVAFFVRWGDPQCIFVRFRLGIFNAERHVFVEVLEECQGVFCWSRSRTAAAAAFAMHVALLQILCVGRFYLQDETD